ncbi:hypothetical protein ACFE04_020933 [Oxalis oulophora]
MAAQLLGANSLTGVFVHHSIRMSCTFQVIPPRMEFHHIVTVDYMDNETQGNKDYPTSPNPPIWSEQDDADDDDDVAVSLSHQDYINQRRLCCVGICLQQQGAASSDVDQVKSTSEQRFPHPGEPACVICGKYGEYICNETNDDICSLECKAVLLESVKQPEKPMSNPNRDVCSSAMKCAMPLPEFGEDTWDHDRHCWSKTRSTLSTYYECAGHLNEHIGHHPSHQQYYSHKLKRLVKCYKSTCEITDIKNLLACHYCFDKAFEKFYDMYTATWNIAGLSMIWSSICCEDHFDWHMMNCLCADTEGSAYIVPRNIPKGKRVELSDFIF